MSDDPKKSYEVGYGRLPKASQFKPGQCPNPKGRPKGSRNFTLNLQEELATMAVVNTNGKRKKIAMRKAAARHVAIKAASGDLKAIAIVREEDTRFQERQAAAGAAQIELASHEDELVMANIVERIRRRVPVPS